MLPRTLPGLDLTSLSNQSLLSRITTSVALPCCWKVLTKREIDPLPLKLLPSSALVAAGNEKLPSSVTAQSTLVNVVPPENWLADTVTLAFELLPAGQVKTVSAVTACPIVSDVNEICKNLLRQLRVRTSRTADRDDITCAELCRAQN